MSRPPPHSIAIIPARGGSKRTPSKNLIPLVGRPLVVHSIEHALASRYVSEVYVSTEDAAIAAVARSAGAQVIERPMELAGDQATSESALLHALDERVRRGASDPELVVFLQCTSPVRRGDDIDRAIDTLLQQEADSLLSVCDNVRFLWAEKDGQLESINYDYRRRLREQDLPKQYRENGSIYLFRPWVLRQFDNRLGGRIGLYEMGYWSSFQIDTPEHVDLCEWILQRPEYRRAGAWPDRVELIVFDFDGVMTDNTVLTAQDGSEAVVCHRGDGMGIALLGRAGVAMMTLSTETNPVVSARCAKLRLPCHQGVPDKAAFLRDHLQKRGIAPERVIYVGNDVNDLECLQLVGMPVAVSDAHPSILPAVRWVLRAPGGRGAVRELADLVLAHLQRTGVEDHGLHGAHS